MKLHHYLRPGLVMLDIQSEGVEPTLRDMVHNLVEQGLVENEQPVLDALLEREAAQSTGIGGGVAIPHAVYAQLSSTIIELATSKRGIDFKSLDEQPVHTLFLLLSPPAASSSPKPIESAVPKINNPSTNNKLKNLGCASCRRTLRRRSTPMSNNNPITFPKQACPVLSGAV